MEAQGAWRRVRDRQRTCCRASSAVNVSETRRDETRGLAGRAIFVSSFRSLASRDVSSRPALPAICLHRAPRHEPKQPQAKRAEGIIVEEGLVRVIW